MDRIDEYLTEINKDEKGWKVCRKDSPDGKIIIGIQEEELEFLCIVIYTSSTVSKTYKEFKNDIINGVEREVNTIMDFRNRLLRK